MHVHQAGDHFALALTYDRHAYIPTVFGDPEFLAALEIGSDLGAVDNVLARQTGDVGAGASDIFSLDHGSLHSLFGECPGEEFTCFPTSQDQEVISLRFLFLCRAHISVLIYFTSAFTVALSFCF